jgi:hypothetical protein
MDLGSGVPRGLEEGVDQRGRIGDPVLGAEDRPAHRTTVEQGELGHDLIGAPRLGVESPATRLRSALLQSIPGLLAFREKQRATAPEHPRPVQLLGQFVPEATAFDRSHGQGRLVDQRADHGRVLRARMRAGGDLTFEHDDVLDARAAQGPRARGTRQAGAQDH